MGISYGRRQLPQAGIRKCQAIIMTWRSGLAGNDYETDELEGTSGGDIAGDVIVGRCVTFFTVYKDKTSLRFCDWDLRLVVLWLFRSEEGDVLFENLSLKYIGNEPKSFNTRFNARSER